MAQKTASDSKSPSPKLITKNGAPTEFERATELANGLKELKFSIMANLELSKIDNARSREISLRAFIDVSKTLAQYLSLIIRVKDPQARAVATAVQREAVESYLQWADNI